jgi:hypothetical protein
MDADDAEKRADNAVKKKRQRPSREALPLFVFSAKSAQSAFTSPSPVRDASLVRTTKSRSLVVSLLGMTARPAEASQDRSSELNTDCTDSTDFTETAKHRDVFLIRALSLFVVLCAIREICVIRDPSPHASWDAASARRGQSRSLVPFVANAPQGGRFAPGMTCTNHHPLIRPERLRRVYACCTTRRDPAREEREADDDEDRRA